SLHPPAHQRAVPSRTIHTLPRSAARGCDPGLGDRPTRLGRSLPYGKANAAYKRSHVTPMHRHRANLDEDENVWNVGNRGGPSRSGEHPRPGATAREDEQIEPIAAVRESPEAPRR